MHTEMRKVRNFMKCLLFPLLCGTISCYPIENLNADKPELKDEIRYPNGTVVGKYTYMDNEGNPINVKYYADDTSYGVELKSVKTNNDSITEWKSEYFDTLKSSKPLDIGYNIPNRSNFNTKQSKDIQNQADKKHDAYVPVKSSDFDTFYPNDVKALAQRQKDKIRVYLDNEKRIIRDALNHLSF